MAEPRLASAFWVQAYLRRLALHDIPAYVTAHGDDTAGAVLVKLNTLDGKARLYERRFNLMEGTRSWEELVSGEDADVEAAIARQKRFDPDIWVVEVEDRDGRHLLDQEGLAF